MEYKNIAQNKKFEKTAMFGYRQEEVNAFINEVNHDIENYIKEIKSLQNNIEVLNQKNETYRQEEESIREVIVKAQKLAKVLIKDAKAKAERIVNEAVETSEELSQKAKSKAETLVSEIKNQALSDLSLIKNEIKNEKDNLATIKKETTEFKNELFRQYKQHLELLNQLPEYTNEKIQEELNDNNKDLINEADTIDFVIPKEENSELNIDNSIQAANDYNEIKETSSRKEQLEKEIENIALLEDTADLDAYLIDKDDDIDDETFESAKETINIISEINPDNDDGTKIINSTKGLDLQFGKNTK